MPLELKILRRKLEDLKLFQYLPEPLPNLPMMRSGIQVARRLKNFANWNFKCYMYVLSYLNVLIFDSEQLEYVNTNQKTTIITDSRLSIP